MQNDENTSPLPEDAPYQHAKWLKPSSEVESYVLQSAGPEIHAVRWEVFRELPKPVSWSEAEILAKHPQDPVEWEDVQANAILDFSDLVSRSYVPGLLDGPRPLNVWDKRDRGRFESTTANAAKPASAQEYAYTPLSGEDEIRILDLLPGQGTNPLAFTLHSTHVGDSSTSYEALSYAWGTRMVDLMHEGSSISLPQNLYRALLSLRDPTHTRSVWADALCINQKDKQERSRQVRMMRRIFKQASQVLIVLDEDDAHVAQIAFELARLIHQGQLETVPPPDSPVWGVLIRLFDKAWFGRMWCLQEVVLASSARVIWGPATAPWEDVGFSAGWLCNIGYEVLSRWIGRVERSRGGYAHEQYSYHPGVYRASLMYSLWSASRATPAKPISFYELLSLTRPFESTDPRDKVFALTGIPTVEADPDIGQCFFEPDYSKTTSQVFVEVAKRIMAQTPGSLHLLGAIQSDRSLLHQSWDNPQNTLPTWVPDWGVFSSRSLVPVTRPGQERPCASRKMPHTEVTFEGSALLVCGTHIDSVKQTTSLYSRELISNIISSLSEAWEEMIEKQGTYPGRTSLPEAFCWTITGGNNWHGQRVGTAERARHIADYEAFRKQYCVDSPFPAIEVPEGTGQTEAPDARRFYEALCHACSNRTFFVTRKGYMGIGPGNMGNMGREGEQVFVLGGAELPFILMKGRSHPQYWSLRDRASASDEDDEDGSQASFSVIGECYVHGIMDGEIGSDEPLDVESIRLV